MTERRCLAPLRERDGAGELLAVVFVVKADSELARWTSSSAGKLELDVEEVAPAFVDVQHVLASLSSGRESQWCDPFHTRKASHAITPLLSSPAGRRQRDTLSPKASTCEGIQYKFTMS